MARRNHALERVGRVGESPIQATSVGDARFLERNSPRSSARVFPIRAHSSPGCTRRQHRWPRGTGIGGYHHSDTRQGVASF